MTACMLCVLFKAPRACSLPNMRQSPIQAAPNASKYRGQSSPMRNGHMNDKVAGAIWVQPLRRSGRGPSSGLMCWAEVESKCPIPDDAGGAAKWPSQVRCNPLVQLVPGLRGRGFDAITLQGLVLGVPQPHNFTVRTLYSGSSTAAAPRAE